MLLDQSHSDTVFEQIEHLGVTLLSLEEGSSLINLKESCDLLPFTFWKVPFPYQHVID